jgi:uncharacterized membrane protein YjjP (DUF1212 family)
MASQARDTTILALVRTLYVNGQATAQMLDAGERLGQAMGLKVTLFVRWGELRLRSEDNGIIRAYQLPADPTGVEMARVAAAMREVDDIEAGALAPHAAAEAIEKISRDPPAPTWLFALAAAAGAVALAVIFGVSHLAAAALIFITAGVGAIFRRRLARLSANPFVQPFCAALLAGFMGGIAVRYDLSSSLRLIAVCPCMILVPGPHILNGALDLVAGRIHLGAARLIYARLISAAISMGLLIGLALLGVSLPIEVPGRAVPLWQDVIAAGVAVAAYSIFFSTPPAMLPWPIAIGMLAHALHWAILATGVVTAALAACVVVGLILTPVSRRTHMPFAAIGFASVVSMLPGVYLFRMASGLVQIAAAAQPSAELSTSIANGMTAGTVIVAMSFGLITPRLVIDYLSEKSRRGNP